jgi:hypothetical protein
MMRNKYFLEWNPDPTLRHDYGWLIESSHETIEAAVEHQARRIQYGADTNPKHWRITDEYDELVFCFIR